MEFRGKMEFFIDETDYRRFRCSVRGFFETIYDQKNEPICVATAFADSLTVAFRMKYGCMVDFSPQPLIQGGVFNFTQARLHLLNQNLGLQQHSNYQFIHIPGLPDYQSGHHYTLQNLKLVCGYQNIVNALKNHFGPWGKRYPIVAGCKMNQFNRQRARLAWNDPPFRRPEDRGKEARVVDFEEEERLATEVGHVLIITGLDALSLYDEEHILEIKNSWGPNWGEGGYSKVSYHFLESLYIPVLRGDVEEMDKPDHPLELNALAGHEHSINGLCFSDDGHRLATACDDGTVRIFHRDNTSSRSFKCTEITMPKIPKPKITTLKAGCHPSPDASADEDASADDYASVVPTAVAFADDDASVVVACKSDARKGSFFNLYEKDNLGGGDDSQFHFKREIPEIHFQKNIVSLYGAKVAGVNGSTMLVSTSEGTDIRLSEGKSGERVGTVDTNQVKNNMATISPDGRYIAAATLDHDVKVWEIEYVLDACSAHQRVKAVTKVKTLTGHKGEVTWLCFTPDSHKIISASVDGNIRVWNINVSGENVPKSEVLMKTPAPRDLKQTTRLYYDRLAISPDGKILAVSQKSVLQWLSFETGEVLDTADGAHDGDIISITWAPKLIRVGDEDMSVLATLGADKKMKLWLAPAL